MSVVLLGPQRRPSLDKLLPSMGLHGPFVTITAGWQAREKDDAELNQHLGGEARNLHLWHRMQEVFEADPEFEVAHRERRTRLLELQELYQLGLSHVMQFVTELQHRTSGSTSLRESAIEDAIAVMRGMDRQHIARVREIHGSFYERISPHERPAIMRNRVQVAEILATAGAVVLPGGHIIELLDAMHLFNVVPSGLNRLPIIAWSAGAMALTSRVVLFDDYAVRGPGCPEVYDQGLGLLSKVTVFPSAKKRLQTGDKMRMSLLARRFAPTVCIPLDPGARVQFDEHGTPTTDLPTIDDAGQLAHLEPSSWAEATATPGGEHAQTRD